MIIYIDWLTPMLYTICIRALLAIVTVEWSCDKVKSYQILEFASSLMKPLTIVEFQVYQIRIRGNDEFEKVYECRVIIFFFVLHEDERWLLCAIDSEARTLLDNVTTPNFLRRNYFTERYYFGRSQKSVYISESKQERIAVYYVSSLDWWILNQ